MGTLAELKSRIASELHRSNLTTYIATAISDAVAHYQSRRFEFNETSATFSTSAGTETYTTSTIPTDIGAIDSLSVTVNGRKVALPQWPPERVNAIATTTNSRGQPQAWSWQADSIRFYPVPDNTYTITLAYLQRLPVPSSDSASNAWTTQAANLIRCAAKKRVRLHVMKDANGAQLDAAGESEALRRLTNEYNKLSDSVLEGSW